MLMLQSLILLVLTILIIVFGKEPGEVVFLIRSQDAPPHNQLSKHLRENLTRQAFGLHLDNNVKVHIVHELFNFPGDWTILHLMPHLLPFHPDAAEQSKDISKFITHNTQWIVLCEDTTNINVKLLMERLNDENHTKPMFLGHALFDREPSIIHHFAFSKNPLWFPYPMLSAGIVLSLPLVKSINDALFRNRNKQGKESIMHSEFSIDAGHEFARFVYDNVSPICPESTPVGLTQQDACGPLLPETNVAKKTNTPSCQKLLLKEASYICPEDTARNKTKCAMYAMSRMGKHSCTPIRRDEIYFAIKTCSRYHRERLPILQSTWSPYAKHIKYFSDVRDDKIPTIAVGLPNVEVGHCAKTLQILKIALKDILNYNDLVRNRFEHNVKDRTIKWIFLADDDTLLSVAGVCQVLGCFDATDEIFLGERYGYRLHASDGFNYITGGGGIAFSLPTVKLIVQLCSCPSPSAPDDMILGSCLHSLQLRALHSPRFHQARPLDYAPKRLRNEEPISFHKFYQIDPLEVYRQWFYHNDDRLLLEEANDVYPVQENIYRRFLRKPELLNLNDLDSFSLLTALHHHSKERHIDL